MNEENLFSLKNKVAVVTGAVGLLGKHFCHALSEAGADIVVCDIDLEKSKDFAGELSTNSIGISADITKPEQVHNLKKKILNEFGKVDILVNNAAINDMFENPSMATELSMFENYPLDMWQKSLDVNITGTFLCSQILGTEMAKRGKGSIINIASIYGIVAPDQSLYKTKDGSQNFYKSAVYPVTKGAVISFTKFLAAYWGNKGVRVNALSPGGVENNQDEFFISSYSARTILGRMAKPVDYNGAIIFLASDASNYMTGSNLVVDGGWTTW